MIRMSLRLFRSTGFHSILDPGEARLALHPGWAVLGASAWVGIACNLWLWLALAGRGGDVAVSLFAGVLAGSACGFVLSLSCWRRTFKPVATLVLLLAAVACAGVWSQGMSLQQAAAAKPAAFFPAWTVLFGWQVPALLAALGVAPVLWLWNTQLRRLSGPAQWRSNLAGMAIAALCGLLAWVAFRGALGA
jgi:lipid A ethanolaminephosphotransferase